MPNRHNRHIIGIIGNQAQNMSRGSAGEYQADERAGVARLSRSEEHTSELQSH